ncbi:MAG: aquaporin [Dehalococcoidia bacterium]|nr:aquaporin [Dehalococcoidia bacterium]
MTDYRKLAAEFVGTFTLIFAGVGAVLASQGTNLVAIGLAHGLAIAVMGSALGHVSGGVFNPALTVGLWVTRRLAALDAVSYIVIQLLGGIAAAFTLTLIFDATMVSQVKLGTPQLASGVTEAQGILVEALMTFFLVIAVFGTAIDSRGPKLGALLIGLTITMDIAMGGGLTGAAMNPARSLGPALVSGTMGDQLVYWVGPILGAVAAAILYEFVFLKEDATE